MKDRVTLTLERDLLARIDARIDAEHAKNRSHAIEQLLYAALARDMPSTAIILAGGGTGAPTALATIKGKSILAYNVALCASHRIPHVIILAGAHAQRIRAALGAADTRGTRVDILGEESRAGTAGALRAVLSRIRAPVIVLNGDELKDIPLDRLSEAHAQEGGAATIALTTVADPRGYGVAVLDGSRILRFVEKPHDDAPGRLISAGAYVLSDAALARIPAQGAASLEHDLFPALAKDGVLHGYPFSGQWFDTGTPEGFARAQRAWKGFAAKGGLRDG